MTIDLNRAQLCAEIRAISGQIKALKALLRARWKRPMAGEQRELCRLKQRATELCALSAFARGKLHLQKPPRGAPSDWNAVVYHQRIVERLAPSYRTLLSESA